MILTRSFLRCRLLLSVLLGLWPALPLPGQTAPARRLRVDVVTDQEPKLSIGHPAEAPRVRVLDDTDQPLRDAAVVFEVLPEAGAGALFGKALVYKTATDAAGEAAGAGLRPNTTPGKYYVRITASAPKYAAATASLHPENVLEIRRLSLDASGGINYICDTPAGTPKVKPPRVSVSDEQGKPVVGARVTFAVRDARASAVFAGNRKALATETDLAGRAEASGLTPNKTAGDFKIGVEACLIPTLCEQTDVAESNVKRGCFPTQLVVATTSLLGAAAGVAVVVAGRKTDKGPQPTAIQPISIRPGTPVFGPPR